jgi:hypothetical protein
MMTGRGEPKELEEMPDPVPLCPPRISHEVTWDRIQGSSVRSSCLNGWDVAWPVSEWNSSMKISAVIGCQHGSNQDILQGGGESQNIFIYEFRSFKTMSTDCPMPHSIQDRKIILFKTLLLLGARDSVVGWGTMLQAGRSSSDEVNFSIYLILPAALWRLSL